MTSYTLAIDATGLDAALHRTVLASLANTYRLVDGDAEVVLVSATDPGKVERLCSDATRAIVVDQPGRLASDELAAIADAADRHSCIVVPALRYAPRVEAAADLLGDARVDLLESTINSHDSLRSSLVEQLALLRSLLGPVASINVLHSSMSHYVVDATMANGANSQVLLNGVTSPNALDEASVHAVSAERRLVVRIDAGPLARPAEIHCYGRDGARSPWPVYQHAHRITLMRLHRLLTTRESDLTYSLHDLHHDVQLATALTA
jgi:hypothetical protein